MFSTDSSKESWEELRRFLVGDMGRWDGLDQDMIPGCCGIEVLCYFERIPLARLRPFVKEIRQLLIDWDWAEINEDGKSPGVGLIAFAQFQKPVMEKILRGTGFKKLIEGNNGKTGNNVYLYGKVLREIKTPRKKAK